MSATKIDIDDLPLASVQIAMLNVLADGKPHHWPELFACLRDDMSLRQNIGAHLTRIRQALAQYGRGVLPEYVPPGRRLHYRLVQFTTL